MVKLTALILFCLVFFPIRYTNDWNNYEYITNNINDFNTDYVFTEITKYAISKGYSFIDIYQFHIVMIGIFLIIFLSNFTHKIILIVLILITYRYVQYANQIRYYLGFFIWLYGSYCLLVNKKKLKGITLLSFSLLSHSALLALFIFLPLYKYFKYITLRKQIIFYTCQIFLIPLVISISSAIFPQFSKYYSETQTSSIAGGLLYALPAILILIYITYISQKNKHNNNEPKYYFLYSLSMFSFLLLPISLYYHLLMERYIYSFTVIWLTYVLYIHGESNKKKSISYLSSILFISLIVILWFYFAPNVIGDTFYIKEVILMQNSTNN
ncbi:MAG: EpsG family protein [Macellibacteroides fermentans]|uniref:EpsG family protein n=1 Tax=Macellibacteroides fermentans TaxID=879969 RepID=UPI003AC7D8C1